MTLNELIEKISELPEEELDLLFAHYSGVKSPLGWNPPSSEVTKAFNRIASEVFSAKRGCSGNPQERIS